MVTFLFWNMDEQDRRDILARLVERYGVNVLVLAESPLKPSDLLATLNRDRGARATFHHNPGLCQRIHIYSAFESAQVREIHAAPRYTIRHLQIPSRTDVLLAAAHLQSKQHQLEASQQYLCTAFADAIRLYEEQIGHQRTVAVGDFNVNPFEPAMVAARGLHAVMDRRIAEKRSRRVDGREYPYFYNPMWSLLGDASRGPPGTYYRRGSEHLTYFWHMLDQVLLRPDLLGQFRTEDLEILTGDGSQSFLGPDGFPNRTTASDHLPLLFKVAL